MLCCRGKQDLAFVKDRMVLRTKAHDVAVPYSAIKHVAVSILLGWVVVSTWLEHEPVPADMSCHGMYAKCQLLLARGCHNLGLWELLQAAMKPGLPLRHVCCAADS